MSGRAAGRVLHVLSQRPSLTGSGITLDALVREGASRGWDQRVAVGVPASEPPVHIEGLGAGRVHPLEFGTLALPFDVPGMSDVMPYPSTRFSDMGEDMVRAYLREWSRHLGGIVHDFAPDVVHCHHVWLVGSLLKDVAPRVPVVTHCHATGLRQMLLCPSLARRVREGCRRNDAFVALHRGHATELVTSLGVSADRVHVVGAGYRDDVFTLRDSGPRHPGRLAYVGKLSRAKGVHLLLDAVASLSGDDPDVTLDVAGSGSGPESDLIADVMTAMAPTVRVHGMLGQPQLARMLGRCHVCVLPSFYEGVPLVLAEALASGCRIVCTRLPGVVEQIAVHAGRFMHLVDLPEMDGVDVPRGQVPARFIEDLTRALREAMAAPPVHEDRPALESALAPLSWSAVFDRIERVWHEVMKRKDDGT